jgi:hypothetical protein
MYTGGTDRRARRVMEPPPSKSTSRELVERAVEAGIGAIPGVGGPLAAMFSYAIGQPFERRNQAWLAELAEAVDELGARPNAPTLEDLVDDDRFVDAVITATRATANPSARQAKRAPQRSA